MKSDATLPKSHSFYLIFLSCTTVINFNKEFCTALENRSKLMNKITLPNFTLSLKFTSPNQHFTELNTKAPHQSLWLIFLFERLSILSYEGLYADVCRQCAMCVPSWLNSYHQQAASNHSLIIRPEVLLTSTYGIH